MVGQTFNESVEVFKKYPGPWIVVGLVVMIVGSVLPVIGSVILLPGVIREGTASIAEEGASPLALYDCAILYAFAPKGDHAPTLIAMKRAE